MTTAMVDEATDQIYQGRRAADDPRLSQLSDDPDDTLDFALAHRDQLSEEELLAALLLSERRRRHAQDVMNAADLDQLRLIEAGQAIGVYYSAMAPVLELSGRQGVEARRRVFETLRRKQSTIRHQSAERAARRQDLADDQHEKAARLLAVRKADHLRQLALDLVGHQEHLTGGPDLDDDLLELANLAQSWSASPEETAACAAEIRALISALLTGSGYNPITDSVEDALSATNADTQELLRRARDLIRVRAEG